jgi:hypothetical protein
MRDEDNIDIYKKYKLKNKRLQNPINLTPRLNQFITIEKLFFIQNEWVNRFKNSSIFKKRQNKKIYVFLIKNFSSIYLMNNLFLGFFNLFPEKHHDLEKLFLKCFYPLKLKALFKAFFNFEIFKKILLLSGTNIKNNHESDQKFLEIYTNFLKFLYSKTRCFPFFFLKLFFEKCKYICKLFLINNFFKIKIFEKFYFRVFLKIFSKFNYGKYFYKIFKNFILEKKTISIKGRKKSSLSREELIHFFFLYDIQNRNTKIKESQFREKKIWIKKKKKLFKTKLRTILLRIY